MRILLIFFFLAIPAALQAHAAPLSLAGITLGADVSTVHHRCKMSTDIPLADERHLNEINLMPQFVPGIKSGSVAYANCSKKGAIVRIKLKYDNPSRAFFDDLLSRFTKNWGKPEKWRGNPFQTVMSWKWSFKNDQGEKINLELTHSEDEEYKLGNFVKLTLRSLWEEEDACHKKSLGPSEESALLPTPQDKLQYEQLIPR
jgi:hypothetical protein